MAKTVNPIIKQDSRGMIKEIHLSPTESNVDWIRSARLKKAAKAGDEKAKEELDRKDRSFMEYS